MLILNSDLEYLKMATPRRRRGTLLVVCYWNSVLGNMAMDICLFEERNSLHLTKDFLRLNFHKELFILVKLSLEHRDQVVI